MHPVALAGNQQQDVCVKDRELFEMIHTAIHMRITSPFLITTNGHTQA